jgi:hypothetical protein
LRTVLFCLHSFDITTETPNELSGRRRQNAGPGLGKMYRVLLSARPGLVACPWRSA